MPEELVHTMLPESCNINSEVLLSTEWDSKESEITQQLKAIIANSDDLQMRTLRDSINSKAGMYNTLLTSIIGISIFYHDVQPVQPYQYSGDKYYDPQAGIVGFTVYWHDKAAAQ